MADATPLDAASPGFARFPDNYGFDFPNYVDTTSPSYPIAPGSDFDEPLAADIPQGQFTDANQDQLADKVGRVHRGFLYPSGVPVTGGSSRNPAPGSVDLIEPMDAGSIPAPGRVFNGSGPVTGGASNNWSGNIAKLESPSAGAAGPVRGGQDYSVQLANAYFATQAQQYSQQAVEAALISAV